MINCGYKKGGQETKLLAENLKQTLRLLLDNWKLDDIHDISSPLLVNFMQNKINKNMNVTGLFCIRMIKPSSFNRWIYYKIKINLSKYSYLDFSGSPTAVTLKMAPINIKNYFRPVVDYNIANLS